ncbi:CPBP family intramembrane metalloprotease [Paenibacillus sp. ACRRX]|uniref:CPBP family intramembrane glutamic endopeptidase n=1 Tax=Paenibacillus sp. ACRRX TaxID=2918206 RepID=UPI001EF40CF3|nr:type II CAAX endopeptidase family protein [Paenibacillus sp. ACRRX]MCG7406872.1 CPBP family intramembrane metalloprotease [Paenibacillus sp. ACRRX]
MKKAIWMIVNVVVCIGLFFLVLNVHGSAYKVPALQAYTEFMIRNQTVFMAVTFILTLLLYVVYFRIQAGLRRDPQIKLFKSFRMDRLSSKQFLLLLAMGIAGCTFSIGLVLIDWIEAHMAAIPALVSNLMHADSIVYVIIGAGVIAPAFEEILFRGIVFNQLRTMMHTSLALLIQALLYAAVQPGLEVALIGFGSGLIYGMLYVRMQSIWAPITVQVVAMSSIFLAKYAGLFEWANRLGQTALIVITLISLLFLFGASWRVWVHGARSVETGAAKRPSAPTGA